MVLKDCYIIYCAICVLLLGLLSVFLSICYNINSEWEIFSTRLEPLPIQLVLTLNETYILFWLRSIK